MFKYKSVNKGSVLERRREGCVDNCVRQRVFTSWPRRHQDFPFFKLLRIASLQVKRNNSIKGCKTQHSIHFSRDVPWVVNKKKRNSGDASVIEWHHEFVLGYQIISKSNSLSFFELLRCYCVLKHTLIGNMRAKCKLSNTLPCIPLSFLLYLPFVWQIVIPEADNNIGDMQ